MMPAPPTRERSMEGCTCWRRRLATAVGRDLWAEEDEFSMTGFSNCESVLRQRREAAQCATFVCERAGNERAKELDMREVGGKCG